jgi:Protein of unknown function (DUF2958)
MTPAELLPEEVRAKLPPLYAQEKEKDPIIHVKFFTPWSSWTWYITEGSAKGGDFLMFGYVIGQAKEWGYVSFNELVSVRGPGGLTIERDLYFGPKRKSEIAEIE